MDVHRVDPERDVDRLRSFLSEADREDYLLAGLDSWIHHGRLWYAEEDGRWIAFARLHDLGEGEGWLSGMRVAPSRRGQGVGTRFLGHLLRDARSVGISAVRVVIEDENVPSRRQVLRAGFRQVETELTVRRGLAQHDGANSLHPVDAGEVVKRPVGWVPGRCSRVDLLPGREGGRFGTWRPALLARWAAEGKLYAGGGAAAAVLVDWRASPRTLWVNPLQGSPAELLPALSRLAAALRHVEWQAFLPATDELRSEYAASGAVPHPSWGERAHLYERIDA